MNAQARAVLFDRARSVFEERALDETKKILEYYTNKVERYAQNKYDDFTAGVKRKYESMEDAARGFGTAQRGFALESNTRGFKSRRITPGPFEADAERLRSEQLMDVLSAMEGSNDQDVEDMKDELEEKGEIIPASFTKFVVVTKRGSYSYFTHSRQRNRTMGKYVTKAGVKRMIARDAQYQNWAKFRWNNTGWTSSGFNEWGAASIAVIKQSSFGAGGDVDTFMDAVNPALPAVGGADQPQVANLSFSCKKISHLLKIHSSCNEMQKVTVWHLMSKQDQATDPLTVWNTAFKAKVPVTTGKSWLITTDDIYNDFRTYPTEFPDFVHSWDIMEKYTFILRPGQTVEGWMKGRSFDRYSVADDPDIHPAGIGQQIMIKVEGVPTHENTGVPNTALVGYSKTGIDWILESEMMVARPTQPFSMLAVDSNLDALTGAQTITPAEGFTLSNDI